MLRFYVVSFALALGLSSFAQLESPDIEAGESFTRAIGDYLMPAEDTGTMGQVWDMSAVVTQSSYGYNILSAPLTALSKSFPDATHALDDGSRLLYISYGDAWTFHGGTTGSIVVIYSDKQTYHPFHLRLETFGRTISLLNMALQESPFIGRARLNKFATAAEL